MAKCLLIFADELLHLLFLSGGQQSQGRIHAPSGKGLDAWRFQFERLTAKGVSLSSSQEAVASQTGSKEVL